MAGIASSSDSNPLNLDSLTVPFLFARDNAIRVNTVTCAVNALVDATPISGPACVYDPASVIRAIDEPTTLQIPRMVAPLDFASSRAANVSAVSPD